MPPTSNTTLIPCPTFPSPECLFHAFHDEPSFFNSPYLDTRDLESCRQVPAYMWDMNTDADAPFLSKCTACFKAALLRLTFPQLVS